MRILNSLSYKVGYCIRLISFLASNVMSHKWHRFVIEWHSRSDGASVLVAIYMGVTLRLCGRGLEVIFKSDTSGLLLNFILTCIFISLYSGFDIYSCFYIRSGIRSCFYIRSFARVFTSDQVFTIAWRVHPHNLSFVLFPIRPLFVRRSQIRSFIEKRTRRFYATTIFIETCQNLPTTMKLQYATKNRH